jgi:site-specific DNA-methyltransferase (cytosine-N4-specific)
MRYCQEHKIKPHPARFPGDLPEYFIRMLTDPGDFVFDPFGGSCITGEVAERLERRWVCAELVEEYLRGARGRFERPRTAERPSPSGEDAFYKVARPGLLWNGPDPVPLAADGGKMRPVSAKSNGKLGGLRAPRLSQKGHSKVSVRPLDRNLST